ncbi:CinA family protein [bacterium]|nr:CinA family protein [bacterium]
MNNIYEELIEKARSLELTIAFVSAGGATELFRLFRIPGCSSIMLEARMLYAESSFSSFLNSEKSLKFVSQQMADQLSEKLYENTSASLCFSLTCALKTNRQRKGADCGYLSVRINGQNANQCKIEVEGTSRAEQDDFISRKTVRLIIDYLQTT